MYFQKNCLAMLLIALAAGCSGNPGNATISIAANTSDTRISKTLPPPTPMALDPILNSPQRQQRAQQNIILLPYLQKRRITSGPYAGAYQMAPGGYLNWYFANLGLRPFVKRMPNEIKTYLNQYLIHLQPDYTIKDALNPTGSATLRDQDSDDSYASTYLSLAIAYVKATKDTAWFSSHLATLKQIAIRNCINNRFNNGLTYVFQNEAKYDEAYLEDNTEVYRGLRDFADYLRLIHDADAGYYDTAARQTLAGINGQFNTTAAQNWWNSYPHEPVAITFYPDAVSQIFPQAYGVPVKADWLDAGYRYLNHVAAGWETGKYDPYPWAILGFVAALRGDNLRARTQIAYMQSLLQKDSGYMTINEIGWMQRTIDYLNGIAD